MSWQKQARICLRLEMEKSGMKCPELARLMSSEGRPVSAQGLRNKLSRGSFSAAFLLQALHALGCETVRLADYTPRLPKTGD
jgi:hypothetical protein